MLTTVSDLQHAGVSRCCIVGWHSFASRLPSPLHGSRTGIVGTKNKFAPCKRRGIDFLLACSQSVWRQEILLASWRLLATRSPSLTVACVIGWSDLGSCTAEDRS